MKNGKAGMTLVDTLMENYGMTLEEWEADPALMADVINLACELEAHCQAMYKFVKSDYVAADGRDLSGGVIPAYEKFREGMK